MKRIYTEEQRKRKHANDKARRQQWFSHGKDSRGRLKAPRPCPERCEVCGDPPGKGRRLDFDHCHLLDTFRGWLCHSCNVALGNAKDDPARLRKLANYLEAFYSR